MSEGEDALRVEATGETVGEAKWSALRALERLAPGLDKAAVRFQVVSEGERGLLGVGYAPARVVAVAPADAAEPRGDESDLGADVRGLVQLVADALGVRCRVDVDESEVGLLVTCTGPELGGLIGRHGQTIDAVQYLLNAIVHRDGRETEVVVDAAGYRERRRATLEALAVRSAHQALDTGEDVALDPMSAAERKVVHQRLAGVEGVETRSEGGEPNRYVVIGVSGD